MVVVEGKQFKCDGGGGGKKNNRNVVAVVVEVVGKQFKCGGGGKTLEMWRWWYIASLFTKQC